MSLRDLLLGATVLALVAVAARNAASHKALVRRDRATLRKIRSSS